MTRERRAQTVVVTGDVTMDCNLAHRACGQAGSASWTAEDFTRSCWQRGGAALLADLVAAVADDLTQSGQAECRVLQPSAPTSPPRPNDPRFHHSFAMWSLVDPGMWRVQQFLGLDRCRPNSESLDGEWQRVVDDTPEADLVVLDDADLGFRNTPELWPRALTPVGPSPWILLKIARPVAQGPLWDHLLKNFSERLIVVMSVDDLRRTEVQISRRLSWERTAQDVVWELTHNPRVNGLSRCAHAVISFGTSGAILLSRGAPAHLFSEPAVMEGGWEEHRRGRIIGYTATLTASLVRQLMLDPESPDLPRGIQSGVAGMRRLLLNGYGLKSAPHGEVDLVFPLKTITAELAIQAEPLVSVPI